MRAARFSVTALGAILRARLKVGAELAPALDPPTGSGLSSSTAALRLRPIAVAFNQHQPNSSHLPPLPHILKSFRSNNTMLQSDKRRLWRLERDERPAARQRAVATEDICAGAMITTVSPLCTSLLPVWRGKRCDMCMSTPAPEHSKGLSACSRCKSAWYCNAECKTCTIVSGNAGSTTCRPVA